MTVIYFSDDQWEKPSFRAQETLSDGVTGDTIIIDTLAAGEELSIFLSMSDTGNSGYVEFTMEDHLSVKNGTAEYIAWTPGTVTQITASSLPVGVTAVRHVNVTGTTKMCISR